MANIILGNKNIEYQVKRGKRKKTVAINISQDAQITVRAPRFVSNDEISKIIKKKACWILERQAEIRKQAAQFPQKEFVSGEQILYLGHHYILIVNTTEQNCFITPLIAQQEIHITVPSFLNVEERKRIVRNALIKWYYTQSERIIKERLNYYSQLLDAFPNQVIIKEQKRRWGSCSINGTIRFNWRAIIAPLSIIDYIVVHELCHLKIKNHSSDFWNLVSSLIPNYKKQRFWLKNNMGLFKI